MRFSSALYQSLLISLVGLATACDPPAPRPNYAFYHWETQLRIDSSAHRLLNDLAVDRLYVKVFDVAWKNGRPEPTAILVDSAYATKNIPVQEVVPVIFLTNEVLKLTKDIDRLATDIYDLTLSKFPLPFSELQIDCDWTSGTQKQYFAFLRVLQDRLGDKALSCTVRLHQYRDRQTQGIPPVSRAVLMAYNTGDLDDWQTDNSIVDRSVIATYTKDQPSYPLPLDLAVAVYDWAAVYRRDRLAYLINEPELKPLGDTSRFERLDALRYRVNRSTYYGGLYLYRGDLIRREIAGRVEGLALAEDVWPEIANRGSERVIFYRIGSRQWSAAD